MENYPLNLFDSEKEPKPAARPTGGAEPRLDTSAELVGSTIQVPISEVLKTICQMEFSGDLQIV